MMQTVVKIESWICCFPGVTILLSLTVLQNFVQDTLPQVSDAMPLLGTSFWYIYEPPWNLYPQLSEPLLTMCFPMRLKSRAFLKQSIPWDVKNSIYLPADRFLLKKPLLTIPPKQLDIWPKCQHCSVEHFTFNCIIQAHSGHLPCMLSKSTFIHAGHSRSGYPHNYLLFAFS